MRLTRKERIKLLLSTYIDAVSPGRTPSDVPGVPSSKPPARTQLWDDGSYFELGQALDRLRGPCPKIYKHTVGHYVESESWARRSTAEKGVRLLSCYMPGKIYVPVEVAENAGYSPGEAKAAAKLRRVAA